MAYTIYETADTIISNINNGNKADAKQAIKKLSRADRYRVVSIMQSDMVTSGTVTESVLWEVIRWCITGEFQSRHTFE